MTHPLEGVTRFIVVTQASAGAGPTIVPLRPPAGCVWEVLYAYGYQDDGAVLCAWKMLDIDTAEDTLHSATVGANAHLHLGTEGDGSDPTDAMYLRGPLFISYDRYLRYVFTASAGAKNGFVHAIVREYRGVSVEA